MKTKKIVLVGGSGFWSDQNHIKSILSISLSHGAIVTAIIDPINPRDVLRHKSLQRLMRTHRPKWLDPFTYENIEELFTSLPHRPDLVIIGSNPDTHYEYAKYCINNNINTLIDKPILVVKNAASSSLSAARINEEFNLLLNFQEANNSKNLAITLLRRRTLKPFCKVVNEISKCYSDYGQGITQLNLIINGGVHKFPSEYLNTDGAHGYKSGVGALSHSAYHYIDVLTWLLETAPGKIHYLRLGLNAVKRVSDYIQTVGYSSLQMLLQLSDDEITAKEPLPKHILEAELDVSITIEMLDANMSSIGHCNFIFNHTTFSPRTRPPQKTGDHANYEDGGRMSHIYLDVHQGPLQSWQLDKNDIVFQGNTIRLQGRSHPLIGKEQTHTEIFESAYENVERPLVDILGDLLTTIDEREAKNIKGLNGYIKDITSERLNMLLYSKFYELLANDSENNESTKILLDVSTLLNNRQSTSSTQNLKAQ